MARAEKGAAAVGLPQMAERSRMQTVVTLPTEATGQGTSSHREAPPATSSVPLPRDRGAPASVFRDATEARRRGLCRPPTGPSTALGVSALLCAILQEYTPRLYSVRWGGSTLTVPPASARSRHAVAQTRGCARYPPLCGSPGEPAYIHLVRNAKHWQCLWPQRVAGGSPTDECTQLWIMTPGLALWTKHSTKEAFRRVFCAILGTNRRGKGGRPWPKTLHERIPGRSCHGTWGDRMASDGGSSSIFSMR